MKKKVALLIIIYLSVASCDIHKQSQKSKTDTDFTEDIETSRKRKGDSVTFIPNVKFKDTTIYTVNREGTTLRTIYDKSGQVSQVDCYASMIDELIKENRRLQQTTKEKVKEKTEEVNNGFFIYIGGAIVVLGVVALLLMFLYIKKNTAIVTSILNK